NGELAAGAHPAFDAGARVERGGLFRMRGDEVVAQRRVVELDRSAEPGVRGARDQARRKTERGPPDAPAPDAHASLPVVRCSEAGRFCTGVPFVATTR